MRADRLLSLLMLLQSRGRLTAQELAQKLEVSERTIYRDMNALGIAGVPVYAERGPGGGCGLLEGYRTTLTGLTETEAHTIFLAGAPTLLHDLGLGPALEAALLKLLASMPSTFRHNIERARQRIHIDALGWSRFEELVPHLAGIQEAVLHDRTLHITYRKHNGEIIERLIHPLGLVAKAAIWYLVASNDAHPDQLRVYRVSRMRAVALGAQPSVRPPAFNLADYWATWSAEFSASLPRYTVTLRADATVAPLLPQLLGEWIHSVLAQSAQPNPDGSLHFTLTFESLEHARTRILGFGPVVEVIEPPELRRSVIAFAQDIAAYYARSEPRPIPQHIPALTH